MPELNGQKVSCCGVICSGCAYYGESCAGCGQIEGRVFWLEFSGGSVCQIYKCCIQEKGLEHCGLCPDLPCVLFEGEDPTLSREENQLNHQKQLEVLLALRALQH